MCFVSSFLTAGRLFQSEVCEEYKIRGPWINFSKDCKISENSQKWALLVIITLICKKILTSENKLSQNYRDNSKTTADEPSPQTAGKNFQFILKKNQFGEQFFLFPRQGWFR